MAKPSVMRIMVKLKFDSTMFELKCKHCGELLDFEENRIESFPTFKVTPCFKCLDDQDLLYQENGGEI